MLQEGKAEGTGDRTSTSTGSGREGQVGSRRMSETQECLLKLLLYLPASPLCRAAQGKREKLVALHPETLIPTTRENANMAIAAF